MLNSSGLSVSCSAAGLWRRLPHRFPRLESTPAKRTDSAAAGAGRAGHEANYSPRLAEESAAFQVG